MPAQGFCLVMTFIQRLRDLRRRFNNMNFFSEIKGITRALNRGKSIIIGCTIVITVFSAFYYQSIYKPKYGSTISVILTDKETNDGKNIADYIKKLSYSRTIDTFVEICKSEAVMKETINNLQLTESSTDLMSEIEVETKGTSDLIKIKVNADKPEKSVGIANQIVKNSTALAQKVDKNLNVVIVDTPSESSMRPSKSNYVNIGISAILGAFLGCAIVFLREYFKKA